MITTAKQNPFSLYDFLGYFIPGAAAIVLYQEAGGEFVFDLASASEYLPFVIAAYCLGHALSFVSSVTVERYSLWVFGYPSKYLLGLSPPPYWNPSHSLAVRRAVRAAVALFLLPISIPDWVFGRIGRLRELYCGPLDPFLVELIQGRVAELAWDVSPKSVRKRHKEKGISADETDYFRVAYHFVLECAPAHGVKFQNYVALYGFLRTMSLVVVLGWWCAVPVVFDPADRSTGVLLLGIGTAIAYLGFMAFMKFYRRFSLEVLMALIVIYPSRPKPAEGVEE